MKRIILKRGEEKRIEAGHPWVYDNEVAQVLSSASGEAGKLEPGEAADVESARKTYLGRALVNPHSRIIARIYSPSKEGLDRGFFKRRLREALGRRYALGGFDLRRESARLVFGEADFLPGLIIDRFVGWPLPEAAPEPSPVPGFDALTARLGPPSSWIAAQFLSYGMDLRRETILDALEEVLGRDDPARSAGGGEPGHEPLGAPAGIIEKSAVPVRELEGLPLREGLLRGDYPPGGILIFENGFPFAVRLAGGQKTGHFLDQRENRLRAAAYARGAKVLDACSYTGGFAVHAARFGAASVIAADASGEALEAVERNARLNGVGERLRTVQGDIFELLPQYERAKERFDLIILDPPAFAKSRSALEGALRGYKEINLRAIRLLSPGGTLVSCSCSQALGEERFKALIADAALDAGRRLFRLDFRGQPPDHPVLLGYDESLYLKCGFYRAL
jgi:23S rRNA (cytosine1962-C5)-methyltransferase